MYKDFEEKQVPPIETLNDDGIHEYIIRGDTLFVQRKFCHFDEQIESDKGIERHGYLIFDKDKLIDEGSDSSEVLQNYKNKIVIL